MRLRIVQALKPVDEAILGNNNGDFYSTVQSIKPDIIMLGYDQTFDEKELEDSLKERGMDIRILRASELTADLTGTRKIVQKIRESMEE